ncbi:MAG: polysaccharide deacetylase family protein [bacterium]|nr:polysaccharide deacetylase family protein [bacterium]
MKPSSFRLLRPVWGLQVLLVFISTSLSFAGYTYVSNFGTNMNQAQFIQLDFGGQIWTCGYGDNSVHIWHPYNGAKAFYSPIRNGKSSTGTTVAMYNPSGIAIDTNGIIYVTCDGGTTTKQNVFKYRAIDGTMLNGFEPSFRLGDIDIDTSNHVFIVEKVNLTAVRFYVMTTSGQNLTGSPITINTTGNLHPGIGVTRDGKTVYIADVTNQKVWKFTGTITGTTASYSLSGSLSGSWTAPYACEVDNFGNVYVSDSGANRVVIFNSAGVAIDTIFGSGLTAPTGVGFHPNIQTVYIAQGINARSLQKWVIPPTVNIPIVGYHEILPGGQYWSNVMTIQDNFRDQIDFLKNHGYTAVSLDTVVSYLRFGTPLPSNPIVITFDDNYEGELIRGVSYLTTRQYHGLIFTTTGRMGSSSGWVGYRPSFADHSVAQLSGYFDTQSHTINHPNLHTLSANSIRIELGVSRDSINAYLPKKCKYLAYPYGGYTTFAYSLDSVSILGLVHEAGYIAAFNYVGNTFGTGSTNRTQCMYCLNRIAMAYNDTLDNFINKIGFTGSWDSTDPYIIDNSASNSRGTFTSTGSWFSAETAGAGFYGAYGSNYYYSNPGAGRTAMWTPNLLIPGLYRVYAWWDTSTADINRASNAPYTIGYAGGTTTVYVDQRQIGFQWRLLGTYPFSAGTTGYVRLTDTANGVVIADAIKFIHDSVIPVELSEFVVLVGDLQTTDTSKDNKLKK